MGKRNTSRRLAMQALYQADLAKIDTKTALENITEADKYIPETLEFAASLANAAWAGKEGLDQVISQFCREFLYPFQNISLLHIILPNFGGGDGGETIIHYASIYFCKGFPVKAQAGFFHDFTSFNFNSKRFGML